MADKYKEMVKRAWKAIGISQWDERDFVTTVTDLVAERNRLYEENVKLKTPKIYKYTPIVEGDRGLYDD